MRACLVLLAALAPASASEYADLFFSEYAEGSSYNKCVRAP